jgi:hypothetical protein
MYIGYPMQRFGNSALQENLIRKLCAIASKGIGLVG